MPAPGQTPAAPVAQAPPIQAQPAQAQPIAELIPTADGHDGAPTPWAEALTRLRSGPTFWLSATAPDGRPHVRPVLGVWVDHALHVASGAGTVKTGLIAANPRVSLTTHVDAMDLVLEGEAVRETGRARLERVAEAYAQTYGWHPRARDGALTGADGAPTAGPPPYLVLAVRPRRVLGFGHDDAMLPTRWTFPA